MVGSVLRTPISSKYCWFGWWLGAWSTPSHDPTQLCDIYISGYKYTLISEWTRLFGLLRILDNLIAGAVCYFCTTISVFCEIYTLRMRVVAHAAILWVWCVFIPSSGVGLVVSVPIKYNAFSSNDKIEHQGPLLLNSLWPGDAIWRHGTRSTLAQVMACCLATPSYYLNQCWLIIGEVPCHSSQGIILRRCEDTNQ